MTERSVPKISKWPFVLGDVVLLTLAAWIVNQGARPLGAWPCLIVMACCVAGAYLCIMPFRMEYQAALKFAEADSLGGVVDQIKNLQNFSNQITFATAQWQLVQEQSAKTLISAKEMAERMTEETKAFAEFMQKANEVEKSHLRLEADKLRRGEGEWLQTVIRLLDHVYALHQAGVRSGQPSLREQLGHFQEACRDVVRRLGLLAFEARAGEAFDEKTHQPVEAHAKPGAGDRVAETVAPGYTYQGRLLRTVVVSVVSPSGPTGDETAEQLSVGGPE